MTLEFKDGRTPVKDVVCYSFIQSRGIYEIVYERSGVKKTLLIQPKEAYIVEGDEREFLE